MGCAKAMMFWEQKLSDIARTGIGNASAAIFGLKNAAAEWTAAQDEDAPRQTMSDLELARRIARNPGARPSGAGGRGTRRAECASGTYLIVDEQTPMDEVKAILGTIAVEPASRCELSRRTPDRHRVADEKWVPSAGPQSQAYDSEADVLLYGGEPGGGKSQLILGLAFNCHRRSLIMRRHYGELERLIEDALKIHGSPRWLQPRAAAAASHFAPNSTIHFRAAQHVGDERGTMGQGRDLLGIDEATHFSESQVRFLMGWVRTESPGQRCRVVLATNPPLTAEGLWVNTMFAPWLDPNFPDPAAPANCAGSSPTEDGKDEWVAGKDDIRVIRGKAVRPTSRTFIPASVRDNPYYAATDYERQLDALPEPYRTHLMGGFRTTFRDAEFQAIPSAWIAAAQERWRPEATEISP